MDNRWTRRQFETTVLIEWFQSSDPNGSGLRNKLVRKTSTQEVECSIMLLLILRLGRAGND